MVTLVSASVAACKCAVSLAVKVCGPDGKFRCLNCHRASMAALKGGPGAGR